jgi:hypothetical protein
VNSSCGWKETRGIKEERELNHLKARIQRDRNEQETGGAVVRGTIFVITGGKEKIYYSEGSQAVPARPSIRDRLGARQSFLKVKKVTRGSGLLEYAAEKTS